MILSSLRHLRHGTSGCPPRAHRASAVALLLAAFLVSATRAHSWERSRGPAPRFVLPPRPPDPAVGDDAVGEFSPGLARVAGVRAKGRMHGGFAAVLADWHPHSGRPSIADSEFANSVGDAPAPRRAGRTVILLLPGARLQDLTRPDVPHLSGVAHHSAAAWVAAWRGFDRSPLPGIHLPVLVRHDPARPFGVRADGTAVERATRAALDTVDLLWIDPGDLERAERYAPLCLPAKAREHRAAALRSADELLEALLRDPGNYALWLLAPPLGRGPALAPCFWWRRGGEPGLLRSGSTHMTGVITSADVAATLAGIAGAAYTGSGCRVTAESDGATGGGGDGATAGRGDAVEFMRRLGASTERTDRLRSVVNYLIQWLLLLLVVAGAVALHTGRRLPGPLALAPLLLPSLLLLDGAWRAGEMLPAAIILLLVIAGLVGACLLYGGLGHPDSTAEAQRTLRDRETRRSVLPLFPQRSLRLCGVSSGWICCDWAALAAMTAAACAVAVLAGNILRWTMLGNSIRLGVRFYGVGNEYMGWWIGAALLATGVPDDRRVRPGAVGLLLGVALLVGHPALGGKVGGVITALAAAGVEAWPLLRRRRAVMAAALGLAAAALLALAAWDASRPAGTQTHLGRLLLHVAAEGPRPFFLIARGKLLTNLRLTMGLWGALLAAGVWLILEARRHAPKLETTHAVQRLLPVAAVAFLCNDSGVIAAALMLSCGGLAAGKAGGAR